MDEISNQYREIKNRLPAEYRIEIQVYYGNKPVNTLRFLHTFNEIDHKHLTLKDLQSICLKSIKKRLERIKLDENSFADSDTHEPTSKKEKKRRTKNHEMLAGEQNDINELYEFISTLSLNNIQLYSNINDFFLHAPLELDDFFDSLNVQDSHSAKKESVFAASESPTEDSEIIASFICQIEIPEKKLTKFYEKFNMHEEARIKNAAPKKGGDNMVDLNSESESISQHERKRKRACQIL